MIAVNRYTTKQSDWAARKKFYTRYPKRADRKGKTLKSFMQDEYYGPHYNGLAIDRWGVQPGSENDNFRDPEWNRYRKYTPKNLCPYQAVNKYIVQPALDQYLAAKNMTKTQYLAANGGVGALSRLASDIYYSLVKGPVEAHLENIGARNDIERDFLAIKGVDYLENPDCPAEFEKYIFRRSDVKGLVTKYVRDTVLHAKDRLIAAYANLIEGDHLRDPTAIPSPQGGNQGGDGVEWVSTEEED